MGVLLVLFIIVPMVELALLIELGKVIGTPLTIGLIVATGALGAALARFQGVGTVARMRREMSEGKIPAGAMLDGVMILVAGAVLMTPGVLTDIVGFLLLVPMVRGLLKHHLKKRFETTFQGSGQTVVFRSSEGVRYEKPPEVRVGPRAD